MFVQMCVKGIKGNTGSREIEGISDSDAEMILQRGLACAWWRNSTNITSAQIGQRLTREELELHIHSFEEKHPTLGGLVCDQSPFISLTAGSVERDAFYSRNEINPAHIIALDFATGFGEPGECYLFYCWVLVALRPSVPVRSLAEEVRELSTYTRYSPYQPEGKIAAKIEVPSVQIEKFEKYEYKQGGDDGRMRIRLCGTRLNEAYISPHEVTNYRDWLE